MADADGAAIVTWAKTKQFTKVGSGECFDLADLAIKDQGAKSADAYGTVTPEADYVWGTKMVASAAAPGDILQYKDYKVSIVTEGSTKIVFEPGTDLSYAQTTDTKSYERPHHTSVVTSGAKDNQITVLEQNVERGASKAKEQKVDYGTHYIAAPDDKSTSTTALVVIDDTWAKKVKAEYNDPEYSKSIDALLAKYKGKSFNAVTTTTVKVTMSGTITAYRVQK